MNRSRDYQWACRICRPINVCAAGPWRKWHTFLSLGESRFVAIHAKAT